jgi:hypothetical protein
MTIQAIITHLQKLSKGNDCTLSIGSKIKIASCDLMNQRITFILPVCFSGKDIDSVVSFSSGVLIDFRKEYFDQKLPYRIENGLAVSGDLTTIEATELIKGEVVIKYNLKIQLNLK